MFQTDTAPMVLLAIFDDAERGFLADNLQADGYAVATCAGAADAMRGTVDRYPDVVVVDLALPEYSGCRVLRALRSGELGNDTNGCVPVLTIGAKGGGELECLRSFDSGADDHLRRPFSYRELVARVASLVRRSARGSESAVVRVGSLAVDLQRRVVRVGDVRVDLSRMEFALLCALAADPARVFTKRELMRSVWGYPGESSRTLDSHACRLRAKLATHTGERFVLNVWGVGYRLAELVTV